MAANIPALLMLPGPAPGYLFDGSPKWAAVERRFQEFSEKVQLTTDQRLDGHKKRMGVVACLNRWYYESDSTTDNSFFIGSWGKGTASRPPRDVDVYFVLPYAVHQRFERHQGNRQSALLHEVKSVLERKYPLTHMSGDGQVVDVWFGTYNVEVVPAFGLQNGKYLICDTNQGGRYKTTDPTAEAGFIDWADRSKTKNNLRPMIRMLKAWQQHCSVPLKSFLLELTAGDFLINYLWREKDFFFFDWIMRDYFAYLRSQANRLVIAPGTYEVIPLGNEWLSRVESAYARAVNACDYEQYNLIEEAGDEWQKIFGVQIPRLA